jgi:hypothetical protein
MSLTLLERNNPRRADELRGEVEDVMGRYPTKLLAVAGGYTGRRARQVKVGEKTATVTRFFMWLESLIEAGLSVFPILAKVQTVALRALLKMDDAQLVKRFFDLLDKEAELEGNENRITATFARSGDLAGLADAAERESAVSQELAAVARELAKRGIDPRIAK